MEIDEQSTSRCVFLFTDIEGSTRLWEEMADAMREAIAHHDRILDQAVEDFGGKVIDHAGDGVFAVFEGGRPLECAFAIQRRLERADWGVIEELRVRIGVHGGVVKKRNGDYRGPQVNRAARIMAVGWGGQILCTPDVSEHYDLPEGAHLVDLGVHQLKDLEQPQQIYGLLHPDLAQQNFPELRSLSTRPNNLPVQPTPFIGREEDIETLLGSLSDPDFRLLSIIGPGGMGKTRLSLQVASEAINTFKHGVFFVPLAGLTSDSHITTSIGEAIRLNFNSREDTKTQLIRHLRDKDMLLVMDNFEHVLDGAPLIAELLEMAPGLKVLSTSREVLSLHGESVHPLNGLPFPENAEHTDLIRYGAIRLFVESAARVVGVFKLAAEDRRHAVRICQLVGGLPLGIELAAAWLRTLNCAEIVREIEQGLDILSTSVKDIPERHRSMRAVFDYSWELMTDEEREVFASLSVFRGGFDRQAAKQVAGASLFQLAALMDKSLLRRGSTGTYAVHELLRQYAEERLRLDGRTYTALRDEHQAYYVAFIRKRRARLRGSDVEAAIDELRAAFDNVRFATRWALEHGNEEALRECIEELVLYYETRGLMREGTEFLQQITDAMAQPGAAAERRQTLRGLSLAAHGLFTAYLGALDDGLDTLGKSLAVLREQAPGVELGYALYIRGTIKQAIGDYDEAIEMLTDSLTILRDVDEPYHLANTELALGQAHAWVGGYEEARRLYKDAMKDCDRIDYVWGRMISSVYLAEVNIQLGKLEDAQPLFGDALAFFRKIDDKRWAVSCLIGLAELAVEAESNTELARAHCYEGRELAKAIGEVRREAICLKTLGRIENLAQRPEAAEESLRAAVGLAWEQHAIPEVLDAMVELAQLRIDTDRASEALRLLAVVRGHPSTMKKSQTRATALLETLRAAGHSGVQPSEVSLETLVRDL